MFCFKLFNLVSVDLINWVEYMKYSEGLYKLNATIILIDRFQYKDISNCVRYNGIVSHYYSLSCRLTLPRVPFVPRTRSCLYGWRRLHRSRFIHSSCPPLVSTATIFSSFRLFLDLPFSLLSVRISEIRSEIRSQNLFERYPLWPVFAEYKYRFSSNFCFNFVSLSFHVKHFDFYQNKLVICRMHVKKYLSTVCRPTIFSLDKFYTVQYPVKVL